MSQYVRFTKKVNERGQLIPIGSVWAHADKSPECYTSTYNYNQDHFIHFQKEGSIKGIRDVTTNKIWWDFDGESAQDDALNLVKKLVQKQIPVKDIEIYFSGSKGFHIIITTKQTFTPDQVATIANNLANGLPSLDMSLYDASQILRVPGSRHPITSLHKIPLTFDELNRLPLEDIKTIAISLEGINESFNWEPVDLPKSLMEFDNEQKKITPIPSTLDISNKPQNWRNCKWNLLQGNFNEGERHQALLILASTARGLGYDKDSTYYLCKSALKKQARINGQEDFPKEELWDNIIKSVFSEDWEGGQHTCNKPGWLQNYCSKLTIPCKPGDEDSSPQKISDIKSQFKEFVLNCDKNTIKTGLKEIDKKLPLTIGMNLGIVGAPSSGKTALALEILKNTSKEGITSVFASLDMHRNRLFEKLLYKVSEGKSREEVYKAFQDNNESSLIDKINEDYGNVYFYDRSCPTIKDIRRYIEQVNSSTPNKVKLVMLDYFERVNSEKSDETAGSKEIAGQLQDLINDYNVCLITLVQPNKYSISGGPDTPILSFTAIKGSSFISQAFRSILSIWRPFLNPETKEKDKYIQFAILKNDLGELDTFDYVFEGKTGTIREFASIEESDQLYSWLKEKTEKSENSNDNKGW